MVGEFYYSMHSLKNISNTHNVIIQQNPSMTGKFAPYVGKTKHIYRRSIATYIAFIKEVLVDFTMS